MSTEVTPNWFAEVRDKIVAGVTQIAQSTHVIAEAYVTAIDRDPAFKDYIAAVIKNVPASFFRTLERVGRGQLDSRFISGSVPHGNRLRNLPTSEQAKAIDGTVELLVKDGDLLLVKVENISRDQADQIFAYDHIRSVAEQRTYIEAKAAEVRKNNVVSVGPIELDLKRKGIHVGVHFISATELAEYLRKLTV